MARPGGPLGSAPKYPIKLGTQGKVDISGNRLVNPARQTAATFKPMQAKKMTMKPLASSNLKPMSPVLPAPIDALGGGSGRAPKATAPKPIGASTKPLGGGTSKPPSVSRGSEGKSDVRKNPVEGRSDMPKVSPGSSGATKKNGVG